MYLTVHVKTGLSSLVLSLMRRPEETMQISLSGFTCLDWLREILLYKLDGKQWEEVKMKTNRWLQLSLQLMNKVQCRVSATKDNIVDTDKIAGLLKLLEQVTRERAFIQFHYMQMMCFDSWMIHPNLPALIKIIDEFGMFSGYKINYDSGPYHLCEQNGFLWISAF